MRKFNPITLIVILLVILTPLRLQALVVSDPGAYARWAQYFEQFSESIKQLEQLESELVTIEGKLTGSRGYGSTIQADINRLRSKLERYTDGILDVDIEGITGSNERKVGDVQDMLDTIFNKERKLKGLGELDKPLVNAYREDVLRAALERSTVEIASARDTYDKLDVISREIDTAESLKDAQDLTNKLLSQLILVQQKNVELLAEMIRAEAAQKYTGSYDDVKRKDETRTQRRIRENQEAQENLKDWKYEGSKYCKGWAKEQGLCM